MSQQINSEITITEMIIRQAITAWDAQNQAVSKFFNKENLNRISEEIAPGKNRIGYIFGHLVAVNDNMLPILGLGERMHPELADFISKPDKEIEKLPAAEELMQKWDEINARLSAHFRNMSPSDWMDRHTRVSAEDFAKEPHRNKLNVLLSRTAHTSYHVGQLALVNPAASN
jgi:hypothetical protein